MESTWTITELAEHAVAALATDGSAQVSGRVRDLPNTRLIRWYTTIGLVDPPLGRRGRTALYGRRHLLQLLAIKRRQAAGRSIAEIQVELTGATDATLEQVTALPASPAASTAPHGGPAARQPAVEAAGHPADSSTAARSGAEGDEASELTDAKGGAADLTETPASQVVGGGPRRGGFWSTRPDVSYRPATVAADYGTPFPSVVQGVRLASGLTLLLDAPTLSGDDLAAIGNAARPLLDELRTRGLLTPAENPAFLPADHSRRSP